MTTYLPNWIWVIIFIVLCLPAFTFRNYIERAIAAWQQQPEDEKLKRSKQLKEEEEKVLRKEIKQMAAFEQYFKGGYVSREESEKITMVVKHVVETIEKAGMFRETRERHIMGLSKMRRQRKEMEKKVEREVRRRIHEVRRRIHQMQEAMEIREEVIELREEAMEEREEAMGEKEKQIDEFKIVLDKAWKEALETDKKRGEEYKKLGEEYKKLGEEIKKLAEEYMRRFEAKASKWVHIRTELIRKEINENEKLIEKLEKEFLEGRKLYE
jgi:hypothetical protein